MVEITAWQVGWAPELHSRFPPAFRAAARALLLAQRRPATAAAGGSSRRRQRSSEGQGQSRNPLALLSADVVLRIIGQAAHPLSSWL